MSVSVCMEKLYSSLVHLISDIIGYIRQDGHWTSISPIPSHPLQGQIDNISSVLGGTVNLIDELHTQHSKV